MPTLDFLNPKDVEKFKQTARSYGKSESDINTQILQRAKQQAELQELQVGSKTDEEISASKALDAIGLLESKYFGDDISEGRGLSGRIKRAGRQVGDVFGPTQKSQKIKSYQAIKNLTLPLINRAIGAGAPQSGELKLLLESIPDEKSTEQEAQQWFSDIKRLLSDGSQMQTKDLGQGPSLDYLNRQTETSPIELKPVLNLEGDIADVGDWTYDKETGTLTKVSDLGYDPEIFKSTTFVDEDTNEKTTGGEIDNKLINFLAKSEFLPIAGSIGGGILGGGLIGGAAGAMGGETLKQGLNSLLNPNEASLSRSAQAILTEGVVDAMFSGLTMGIGKVSKGLGLVLKQGGKKIGSEALETASKEAVERLSGETLETAAKETAKITTKEFTESTGKEFLEKLFKNYDDGAKGLKKLFKESGISKLKNLYKLSDKQEVLFKDKFGLTISDAIYQFADAGDLSKMVADAGIVSKSNRKAMEKLLKGSIKYDDAIKLFDDAIEKSKKLASGPELQRGINEIKKYKDNLIRDYLDRGGTKIPDIELQRIKKTMAKSVYNAKGEYGTAWKEISGTAEREIREYLTEKYGKNYAGQNVKNSLTFFIEELGKEGIEAAKRKSKLKELLSVWDAALLGISPNLFITKKGYDVLSKILPEKHKMKFYKAAVDVLGNMPKTQATKNRMRALILGALKDGIPLTVNEQLVKAGARGVSSFDLYKSLNEKPDDISISKTKKDIQQSPSLNLNQTTSVEGGGGNPMPSLKLTPSDNYDYKQLQSRPYLYK